MIGTKLEHPARHQDRARYHAVLGLTRLPDVDEQHVGARELAGNVGWREVLRWWPWPRRP